MNATERAAASRRALREMIRALDKRVTDLENAMRAPEESGYSEIERKI